MFSICVVLGPPWAIAEHGWEGSEAWGLAVFSCPALTRLSFHRRSPFPSTWDLPVASSKGENLPSLTGWADHLCASISLFGWLYFCCYTCLISKAVYSWQKTLKT